LCICFRKRSGPYASTRKPEKLGENRISIIDYATCQEWAPHWGSMALVVISFPPSINRTCLLLIFLAADRSSVNVSRMGTPFRMAG